PDRPRVAGTTPTGGRSQQWGDRCGVVHQQEDGERACEQHLAQARGVHPGPGRRPRRTRRHPRRAVTIGRRPDSDVVRHDARYLRTTEIDPSARVAPDLINRSSAARLTWGGAVWWAT